MQSLMLMLCASSGCSLIVYAVFSAIFGVTFDRECIGHLRRAANASTVEIAARELEIALNYLVAHRLTRGYTSVFYRTPDEDIGYWYRNLKDALAELRSVRPEASIQERSSLLLKLRGTILDHGSQGGDEITKPTGISLYPHNLLFGMWGIISLALFIFFSVSAVVVR